MVLAGEVRFSSGRELDERGCLPADGKGERGERTKSRQVGG